MFVTNVNHSKYDEPCLYYNYTFTFFIHIFGCKMDFSNISSFDISNYIDIGWDHNIILSFFHLSVLKS